jgi:hypothetical protein
MRVLFWLTLNLSEVLLQQLKYQEAHHLMENAWQRIENNPDWETNELNKDIPWFVMQDDDQPGYLDSWDEKYAYFMWKYEQVMAAD